MFVRSAAHVTWKGFSLDQSPAASQPLFLTLPFSSYPQSALLLDSATAGCGKLSHMRSHTGTPLSAQK